MIYWTRERVRNGLARFARDYYPGREKELPPRPHNYRNAIPLSEQRTVKQLRLYPPFQVILRYYSSMVAAWADLGFEVEETPREYWTREEVLAGLRRFYEDHGCCPTYHGYLEKAQFTEKYGKDGKPNPDGAYNRYPSHPCIGKFFGSMREAWTAAGFDVDRHWEPWSPLEDWFVLETVGILPRTEVSELLKRSVPAIKRRLYDLGRINSKNRWGMPVNKASTLLGVGGAVIKKYLECGIIPYFRGNKCLYVNPADLPNIVEFDWAGLPETSELAQIVRRALIIRAIRIVKHGPAWRKHEVYTFQPTRQRFTGRVKNARVSAFSRELPPPPNDLKTGDWVRVRRRVRQVSENRLGRIVAIYYSPANCERADGTRRTAWMAHVDFPKMKRLSVEDDRVKYTLPLDVLIGADAPQLSPNLDMSESAIRARKRYADYRKAAGRQLDEINRDLTGGAI